MSPNTAGAAPRYSISNERFSLPLPSPALNGSPSISFSNPIQSPNLDNYRGDDNSLPEETRQRQFSETSADRDETMLESLQDGAVDDDGGTNPRKRPSSETVDYPRRRATIACDLCRSRKSRCDGGKPKCRLCTELNATCEYRERGTRLDAGDKLILEHLSRIEQLLHTKIPSASPNPMAFSTSSPAVSSGTVASGEEMGTRHPSANPAKGFANWTAAATNISTMPKMHTTPALHLLQWPSIRDLVPRPYDTQNLLQLEMSRPPLQMNTSLSLDLSNTATYVSAFFNQVNQFYACVNPYNWTSYYRKALSQGLREGQESCIVLLVLALGKASTHGSISRLPPGEELPGMPYFAAAWALLPGLITQTNILSAQCMILASAYLFYLVRPLDAWSLLGGVSLKLQLLLGAPGRLSPHAKELSERVYWNALMFESDLLAELDLPHSGIVQFEESIGLPSGFKEEVDEEPAGRDELWYFLAEIALRRLLNRVSHLIYSKGSMTSISSLGPLVAELDYQLTQWYQGLPPSLQFPHNRVPHSNTVQTVLRFRYYACRTIIFRPYIYAVLENESIFHLEGVQENCRKCLEASMRQLENITSHHAGHLPYLWQGCLSIVSQTLLVMAGTMCRSLSTLLPPSDSLDRTIDAVIVEIETYARLAPSLNLSAEIVREAEERRQMILRSKGLRM
ncbi:MAG: hypothetical protein M1837_000260 [Sclerophora amabilis]|nr:MAG: hypothetical protein M1837_000260 [Sclerophora amabilis]